MTRLFLLAFAAVFKGMILPTAAWMPITTVPRPMTRHSSSTTSLHSTTKYTQEECQAVRAALPSPLIDAKGNVVDSDETIASLVQGQRVALYFAAGWSRDCRELDFMLDQYRSALRDSEQPIQLIYVPSDNTQDEQLGRMQELGLELGVPLGETADALKKRYGIWPDAEVEKFGGVVRAKVDDGEYVVGDEDDVDGENGASSAPSPTAEITPAEPVPEEMPQDGSGRRSGIPAFVVLDNKGQEFCFLNTERDSITALADWPLDDLQGHW